MKAWHAALVGMMLLLTFARPTLAEIPAAASQPVANLVFLFPNFAQLPAGMVLVEEGSRSEAEIAATFRDPIDAAQVLTTWGWTFNTYRIYVAGPGAGPETPTRLEVSLTSLCRTPGPPMPCRTLPMAGRCCWDCRKDRLKILASVRGGGHRHSASDPVSADWGFAGAGDRGDAERAPVNAYYLALGSATDVAYAVLGNAGGIRARARSDLPLNGG